MKERRLMWILGGAVVVGLVLDSAGFAGSVAYSVAGVVLVVAAVWLAVVSSNG